MRRYHMIVTTVALVLLTACGGGGSRGDTLGPPPETSPTGNVPPASPSPAAATGGTGTTVTDRGGPMPTTSPGITGSVNAGNASITVSGGLQTTQPSLPLASPAIYAPAPGTFTLAWSTATAGFALGGATFIGTEPTSETLRLTLSVHSASGTASFTSVDGGCEVTVTTADATTFDGTFSCGRLSDANGTVVIDAQGTFSASG